MLKRRLTMLLGLVAGQVGIGALVATLIVNDVTAAPAPPPASHAISVGPGFTDVSPHQLVRTSADILYTVAPTCDAYPNCPGNTLRVFRADQPGAPTSFTEQDAAHRPAGIGSAAIALDGADTIHAVWNDRTGTLRYRTFSTATNLWSGTTDLAATNWTDFGQGDEGVALALDSTGTPHALWSAKDGAGILHLWYANRATGWAAEQVDDVPLTGNRRALHPTVAFKPNDDLVIAWLEGTFNYTPDGVIRVRTRTSAAGWGATETIADTAMTTIDNGPSLLVTPDGTTHLTFLNAGTAADGASTTGDFIHYYYNTGARWVANHPGGGTQITHDPSLGPGPGGGVRIYGHGWQGGRIDGHGSDLDYFEGAGGGGAWGAWTLYAVGSYDSSVSTRWAQFFHPFPQTLDIAFWSDVYPSTLFVGADAVAGAPGPVPLPVSRSSVPPGAVRPSQLPAARRASTSAPGAPGPASLPPRRR